MNKCEHVQATSTEGAGVRILHRMKAGSCMEGGIDPIQKRGLGQSPVQRGNKGQNSVQAS